MKKISKKVININSIHDLIVLDFCLVSSENILNINLDNIKIYKKGLYRFLLPGKFFNEIKEYFKKHTYINFNINKNLLNLYIQNKNIIIFKFKGYIFYNNKDILRFTNVILNFESLKIYYKIQIILLFSLFYF